MDVNFCGGRDRGRGLSVLFVGWLLLHWFEDVFPLLRGGRVFGLRGFGRGCGWGRRERRLGAGAGGEGEHIEGEENAVGEELVG